MRAAAPRQAAADEFARTMGPIVRPMRQAGLSLHAIADALQAKSIRTARGGATWMPCCCAQLSRLPAVQSAGPVSARFGNGLESGEKPREQKS